MHLGNLAASLALSLPRYAARRAYVPADPFLPPAEAAAEIGRSLSSFRRARIAGEIPPPCIMVGRSPRWRRSVLRRAIGVE